MGMGNVSADDEHVRIQQAHGRGQHIAECTSCGSDDPYRVGVPPPYEIDNITCRDRRVTKPPQISDHSPATGDRCQATRFPATAAGFFYAGNLRMTDITFGRARPAQQLTIDDHRSADSSADLYEYHQVRRGIDPPLLAQTEQVGVVVDHRRHLVIARQLITDGIVVPARHADRTRDPSGMPVHGTRYSEANSS